MSPQVDDLDAAMASLQERERKILHMRFVQKLTLEEIGKRGVGINGKNIDRERVRQILAKATRKIRRQVRMRLRVAELA